MSDGSFAQFETSFVLNDARLGELTASQRWIYVVLWCYAVESRKTTTKMPQLCRKTVTNMSQLCHNIARLSRVDARIVRPALTKLQQLCLIEMPDENTITVCGVREKHPKLKWKENGVERKNEKTQIPLVEKSRVEKSRVEASPVPVADADNQDNNNPTLTPIEDAVNRFMAAWNSLIPQKFFEPYEEKKIDCDLEGQKMIAWIKGNPDKIKKKYRAFIANWLNRALDTAQKRKEGQWPDR